MHSTKKETLIMCKLVSCAIILLSTCLIEVHGRPISYWLVGVPLCIIEALVM
jgi:hypothetical protein